jgi:hypothetical protein
MESHSMEHSNSSDMSDISKILAIKDAQDRARKLEAQAKAADPRTSPTSAAHNFFEQLKRKVRQDYQDDLSKVEREIDGGDRRLSRDVLLSFAENVFMDELAARTHQRYGAVPCDDESRIDENGRQDLWLTDFPVKEVTPEAVNTKIEEIREALRAATTQRRVRGEGFQAIRKVALTPYDAMTSVAEQIKASVMENFDNDSRKIMLDPVIKDSAAAVNRVLGSGDLLKGFSKHQAALEYVNKTQSTEVSRSIVQNVISLAEDHGEKNGYSKELLYVALQAAADGLDSFKKVTTPSKLDYLHTCSTSFEEKDTYRHFMEEGFGGDLGVIRGGISSLSTKKLKDMLEGNLIEFTDRFSEILEKYDGEKQLAHKEQSRWKIDDSQSDVMVSWLMDDGIYIENGHCATFSMSNASREKTVPWADTHLDILGGVIDITENSQGHSDLHHELQSQPELREAFNVLSEKCRHDFTVGTRDVRDLLKDLSRTSGWREACSKQPICQAARSIGLMQAHLAASQVDEATLDVHWMPTPVEPGVPENLNEQKSRTGILSGVRNFIFG